ncbi:MAG: phosphate ABC transporter permease subunit PstC [Actinobacteria bacterium]|nr:phosphate ABC transporter permease subunit PstC [Actinomycetota bacterium]
MSHRVAEPGAASARLGDRAFRGLTLAVGMGLIAVLVVVLWVLAQGGAPALARFGPGFLVGRNWDPVHQSFGALPYVFGTLVTSAIAITLAVPVAVGLAILLNEPVGRAVTAPLASFVDVLAAIPSVVYGLWGLAVLSPAMERHVEPFLRATIGRIPILGRLFSGTPSGGDLFTAGVVLAIMILPIVTAISREVFSVVPRDLREAAKALGATRYETIRMGVLPYARPGIVGATMLGLGRALGETIAVSMVVGGGRSVGASLFAAGSTIPSVIASQFLNAQGIGYHRPALLALALVLVTISLSLAALSRLMVRRTARLLDGGSVEGAAEGPALEVSG